MKSTAGNCVMVGDDAGDGRADRAAGLDEPFKAGEQ